MKALSDLGIELWVTGDITPADLPLFKEIAVTAFIAGRAGRSRGSAGDRQAVPPPSMTSGIMVCVSTVGNLRRRCRNT